MQKEFCLIFLLSSLSTEMNMQSIISMIFSSVWECPFFRNEAKSKENAEPEYSVDEYHRRRKEKDKERKRFLGLLHCQTLSKC